MGHGTIWSTEKVNEALEKIRFVENDSAECFHEKDFELKAANISFQLTSEEEEEFIRCSQDVEYFVTTYCRFLTDTGRILGNLLLNQGFVSEISLLIHPIIVGIKSYNMFSDINKNLKIKLIRKETLEDEFIWVVYGVEK